MRARAQWSDDRGETLLELLISIMILASSVVAIMGGFASSIHMSDVQRAQSAAGTAARNYAEAVASFIAVPGTTPVSPATTISGYSDCATSGASSPYSPSNVHFSPPTGYDASIDSVTYWNGSGFVSACPSPDTGAQLVTVRLERSSDQAAVEKVSIVVRKPCRMTDAPC